MIINKYAYLKIVDIPEELCECMVSEEYRVDNNNVWAILKFPPHYQNPNIALYNHDQIMSLMKHKTNWISEE